MKQFLMMIVFMCVSYLLFSTNGSISESDSVSVKIEKQAPSIDMVLVDGGTLTMGDTSEGKGFYKKSTRKVTLSSFWIGKYEITQKQWVEVMGFNNSKWKGDDLPVEGTSSYECLIFCNKLSLMEGLTPCYIGEKSMTKCDWTANGYRMPTEAEWQFAAKGGNLSNDYDYSGSNTLEDVAWYKANSGSKTHPVGQKQPNELGVYDMSGNVMEWCWDWMGAKDYYSTKPVTNPKGEPAGVYRVRRGGAWSSKDKNCKVDFRDSDSPDIRYGRNNGFRVCRNK